MPKPPGPPRSLPMDDEPEWKRKQPWRMHPPPHSGPHHSEPMQLDTIQKQKTKQERLSKGLCLYCGKSGHFAAQCPNKKKPWVKAHQALVQEASSQDEGDTPPAEVLYEPKN
jgi:hypothetical protein